MTNERYSAEREEEAFREFDKQYGNLSEKEQAKIYVEAVQRRIESFRKTMPSEVCDAAQKSVERLTLSEQTGWPII